MYWLNCSVEMICNLGACNWDNRHKVEITISFLPCFDLCILVVQCNWYRYWLLWLFHYGTKHAYDFVLVVCCRWTVTDVREIWEESKDIFLPIMSKCSPLYLLHLHHLTALYHLPYIMYRTRQHFSEQLNLEMWLQWGDSLTLMSTSTPQMRYVSCVHGYNSYNGHIHSTWSIHLALLVGSLIYM